MKIQTYLLLTVFFAAFSFLVFYSPRKITVDRAAENFDSQFKKHVYQTVQAYRADEYRARYEQCDQHHNCRNLTGMPGAYTVKNDLRVMRAFPHRIMAQ